MKSRLTIIAALTSIPLFLTGCSTGGSDEGSIKLEFQTGRLASDAIQEKLVSLAKGYEETHKGVSIDVIPATQTYEADMKVRLAANDMPDRWGTHGWSLLRYSEFLEPLNNRSWAKDMNPALDTAMKNEKGEFFALPVDTDVSGILYNADVLKANSIDPTSIDTISDFEAAAKTLKSAGITPITSSGKDNWFAGNLTDWLAPGAFTDTELASMSKGTFQSEPYTTVLQKIADWKKDGFFNADYSAATTDDIATALATGKTAFVFMQNNLVTNALTFNPDAKLGYMPVPAINGSSKYLIGGEGLAAFGVAKSSPDKDAALDFIDFLAEPANESALATAAAGIPGLTTATTDLAGLTSSYDEFVASDKYPLVPYFDRVYLPNGMWNTVVSTTDSIISGQANPKDAVSQAQKDFTSLYGQNK